MIPTIKPTIKQDQLWKLLRDEIVSTIFFGGGKAGGKSWVGCEWLITNTYFYPESKWFIARKELKRLMMTTYVTFQKVLKFHGIPATDFHMDGKLNVLRNVRTGAKIDLLDAAYKPADDPLFERFGSLEYTGGWSEEAPELKFRAFEYLNASCGRHMNKEYGLLPAKHLLTGNPSKGWPYLMFYRPWKDGKLPPEYAFIQALYKDNPHTAEEQGKQLAMMRDPAQRARLMMGSWEFTDDPSSIINYDSLVKMFSLPREEEGEKYIVVDAARFGKDRIVISLWVGLTLKRVIIKRKQGLEQTEADIDKLELEEGVPRRNQIYDEDGVGGSIGDHRKGMVGFVANRVPVTDEDDVDEDGKVKRPNFANLKAQCGYLLADYINAGMISAAGRSPKLQVEIIEELEQIRAKDTDKDAPLDLVPKADVKDAIGRSPDIGDIFIMRMYFELKKPKQKKAVSQTSPSWIGNRWKRNVGLSTG